MNLDEFKEALSSDATKECEKLKKMHEEYERKCIAEIKNLRDQNTHLKNTAKALANRCYVQSQGNMCMFCGIEKDICKYSIPLEKRIILAKEFERSLKNEEIK